MLLFADSNPVWMLNSECSSLNVSEPYFFSRIIIDLFTKMSEKRSKLSNFIKQKPCKSMICRASSGRLDSNQRPLAPHASALPGCATSRNHDFVGCKGREKAICLAGKPRKLFLRPGFCSIGLILALNQQLQIISYRITLYRRLPLLIVAPYPFPCVKPR